ncbi:hypothetical protein ACU61A_33985 [Pseudonocardia sichuanensis]
MRSPTYPAGSAPGRLTELDTSLEDRPALGGTTVVDVDRTYTAWLDEMAVDVVLVCPRLPRVRGAASTPPNWAPVSSHGSTTSVAVAS